MVENRRVPSLPLSSDNESGGYTTSHTTISQTPQTQLSSGRGCPISPHGLNEDMRTNSSKRPRVRPSGSKNRPIPPIVIREDDDTILKPTLIEIPRGNDIVETLINLGRHRNANITVLSGSGPISEITLHNPMSPSPAFPIKGTFNMISIFGTYINADCGRVPPQFITNSACSSFSIYISLGQGQVFGGIVGGKVISAGPVIVTATLFKKPKHQIGAFVNRNIEEVNMIANHTAVEPNNNNGNKNNTVVVSAFDVEGSNSMSLNSQLPPPPLADVNEM